MGYPRMGNQAENKSFSFSPDKVTLDIWKNISPVIVLVNVLQNTFYRFRKP